MKRTFLCCVGLTITAIAAAQATSALMKAVVVHEFGGPEVMKYEDVPRPDPKEDEILVRVMAAAVNPVDSYVRQGMLAKHGMDKRPAIIGYDISGVVEKTGANAKKFKAGDKVYSYLSVMRGGGYAEFAVAKESETALKPKNINFEEAAAVPLAATTAWQSLVDEAKLNAGQTVLVHGGSGGVGSFAIQIAKALARSYGVVKKGGIIVSITDEPDQTECAKHGISGSRLGAHPDAKVLEELTKLIEAGKMKPIVSQTLPLADASKAHQQIETHHTLGKIVLKVADTPK